MQSQVVDSDVLLRTNAENDVRSYISLLEKWTTDTRDEYVTCSYNSVTSTNSSIEYRCYLKQLNSYNSNMTPIKQTKITSLSKTSSSSSSLSSSPSRSSTTSSSSSSSCSYANYHYETTNFTHSRIISSDNYPNSYNDNKKLSTHHLPPDSGVKATVVTAEESSLPATVTHSRFLPPQQNVPSGESSKTINDEGVAASNNYLVYRDGNLISGNFNALVQHLVPTHDYYPDKAYLFTFLLASRLFATPHELLVNVVAVCNSQQQLMQQPCNVQKLTSYVPRLMRLMKEWSELFPRDFQDKNFLDYSISIMEKCVTINENLRSDMNSLLSCLVKKVYSVEHYEEYIATITANTIVDAADDLDTLDTEELCSSSRIVAESLCHIELNRLAHISSEEFVQEYAKNKYIIEAFYKSTNRIQSFKGYIEWFNKLSLIVATEICRHSRKKHRSKTIEFWVEIARECFNIGNFNSLMSIISGLNMSPVVRLKKTWNKVQSGKFSILEHQMDPSSNFSSYRSTLKAAMWRSAGTTDKRQQIIIPFFSLLMKDIYFLNECYVDKLPNGHINFEKFWHLAKQVTEFMAWKQITCPFLKEEKLIAFLQECPVMSMNALTLASFECEPPETSVEKDQYKLLKSEIHQ